MRSDVQVLQANAPDVLLRSRLVVVANAQPCPAVLVGPRPDLTDQAMARVNEYWRTRGSANRP